MTEIVIAPARQAVVVIPSVVEPVVIAVEPVVIGVEPVVTGVVPLGKLPNVVILLVGSVDVPRPILFTLAVDVLVVHTVT